MPLNIVVFSAYFPPHMGGVEQFTFSLCEQLTSMGHNTTVITSSLSDCPDEETLPNGVHVFRLPTMHFLDMRFPLPVRNARFHELERTINNICADAVVINTRFYPLSLYGARFAKMKQIEPIVIEHGSAYLSTNNPALDRLANAYEHALAAKMKRRPAHYYGVSEAAANWLSTFGIEAQGIIHNSIDADAFISESSGSSFRHKLALGPNTILVAFTGRLVPEKGIWVLCECARTLQAERLDVMFAVAGDGPDMEPLSHAAPKNMTLLGRLDKCDVAALLLQSDIFCLPSESEGLPTSLLEAAVCGSYLICTNVGGAREIIPDDNYGAVIEPPITESLTQAIRNYALHPERYREIRDRTRKRTRELFSWEKAATGLLKAINASAHRESSD